MLKTNLGKSLPTRESNKETQYGCPLYSASDDIYNQYEEEKDIDPEDISSNKALSKNIKYGTDSNPYGDDLDIPDSDLYDPQGNLSDEDEENNYYSLGGDDHNDLDEDNGQ